MTSRSLCRVFRWVALAAVAPVLWACNARTLEKPNLTPEQTYAKTFQQTINRNVDMLFMVDNSSSMTKSQDNLNRNFPVFMNRLMNPPGLPNIHVAVISSDMGAGDGVVGCDSIGGNNGVFQYSPRGTCASTGLQDGATFISNVNGVANYTGNLPDVFTCIAALGDKGCGFEHQFASITRALGVDGLGDPPQENQGFLRKDAYLVIIMITNEDDCSASPGPGGPNGRIPLFDTTANTNMASQLGPPSNFRCNEFGHLCTDSTGKLVHPNRNAPNLDVGATVSYANCQSNDQEGYLLGVADTANRIKKLKDSPDQVIVAAITGPATPYTVTWKTPPTADTSCNTSGQSCPWPVIANSCMASDMSFADPSVRITEFVNQFGANGLVLPICSTDFSGSLDRIAMLINQQLKAPCIPQKVANKAGTQEPDCTVVSHVSNGTSKVDMKVPWCGSGAAAPCWQLSTDAACSGSIVDVKPDPSLPMSTTQDATVNCSLCDPMFPDPNRGC